METLRTTAIVVLASALAAVGVLAGPNAVLAAPSRAQQAQFRDPPIIPAPQASDAAVVNAARKARAVKAAKEAGNRKEVWNDDNIPRIPRDITVVGHSDTNPGSEPAATDGSAAAPAPSSDAAPVPTAPQAAPPDTKEELTRVRERAADLDKDLELAQRQFELDQNQLSQNPDFANDHAGQAKLKSEADQLQAKRQALDELKKKINDLEAQTKP